MAKEEWKIAELEILGSLLKETGDKILSTCLKARTSFKMDTLVCQARSLWEIRGRITRLASEIEDELIDQYNAKVTGTTPQWQLNRTKHENAMNREITEAMKNDRDKRAKKKDEHRLPPRKRTRTNE